MLPLVGIAQERNSSKNLKQAQHQEYLQSIYGNKTDALQSENTSETLEVSAENQKLQQIQNAENQLLLEKLSNAGIDTQKYFDAGYTLQDIVDEFKPTSVRTTKLNSVSSDILSRGDACSNATVLLCDTPDTFNTFGATNSDFVACGTGFTNGDGVWYSFTGNQDTNVITATSNTSGFQPQVRVYTGSCGSLNCATATGQSTNSVSVFAPGGDTIYVYVSGFGATDGSYTITRTSVSPCNDAPPGDGLSPDTAYIAECGNQYSEDTTGTSSNPNHVQGPSCDGATNPNGVWYKINVTADYPLGTGVTLDLCASDDYDTEVHVYEGLALNCVGSDDDSCGINGWRSEFEFDAQPNTDYYIYVGGFGSFSQGTFIMDVLCDGVVPPPPPQVPNNDTCQTAIELACDGIPVFGNTTLATDTGNPGFCGLSSGEPAVWYTYSGDAGVITVSLCGAGTDFDTYLSVFTGNDCNALLCEDTDDDGCGTFAGPSEVTFNADGSTVYYIAISGWAGDTGNYQLDVTCDLPPTIPDNDLCADAEVINCDDVKTGNTTLATAIGVEGLTDCDGQYGDGLGVGVWYVATGNGDIFTFDACGSDYDTKVAVFTGSCGALTCFTGNDDSFDCSDGTPFDSAVSFTSVPGETYYIYVSGFTGFGTSTSADTGNYVLEMTCQPDPCTNATLIACGDEVLGNNSGANGSTIEPNDGDFCGTSPDSPGVMYEIIGDGRFVDINTCNSTFDTKLNVYSGACGALECLTGNDDWSDSSAQCGAPFRSFVRFFAEDGESYFVWVSGAGGATGDFTLNVSCVSAVANDLCGAAVPIECDSTESGSTVLSTERGNPEGACEGETPNAGVWYIVAGTGGDIVASTVSPNTDFDTLLIVYSGSCDALECVDSNDDFGGLQSQVTFASNLGELYYVYVTGFGSSRGSFDLSIDCLCAPALDGTQCITIYDGYDPFSTQTLTAEMLYGEEPISYLWSNNDTNQTTVVSATDGTQNYSVTMTDAVGCVVTQEYFVNVIDVNCDTRGTDKVLVCHNGTTICVAPSAVAAHRAHGDELGNCGEQLDCNALLPFCDSLATAPADQATDVSISPTISWNSATGVVTGYTLNIGTTSGASDVLSLDVGNTLSYTYEAELDYLTEYFVSIVPYNDNGPADSNCFGTSFTTQEDPLPNDDCDGAVALTVNPEGSCAVTYIADHTDATDSGATFTCDFGTNNFDSWYTFVAPATGAVILDITDITQSGTPEHAIFDACNGTQIACESGNNETFAGLTPGVTYTLAIWYDNFTTTTRGTFEICLSQPAPPPANDTCSGAIALTVNAPGDDCAVVYSADHTSANDSGAGPSCDVFDNIDTWYTFTAPASGSVELSTSNGSQGGTPGWVLYDSCGGTQLECVNNTSTTQTFNGLTPGAVYTLNVFYDTFQTEGTFDICLNEPAPPSGYCDSFYTQSAPTDEYIDNVQLNTINNTSGDDVGYGDYTSISTDLTAGSSYSITITPGFDGTTWNESYGVWIDYNQNFIFEASELVYQTPSATQATVSGNFTVPATALSGSTRMRIIQDFSTFNFDPCTINSFGETEDYTVNIVSGARPASDITKGAGTNEVIGWTMSPNPTRDNVNLDLTNYLRSDVTIQVVDFTGKLISVRQLDNLQTSRYTLELSTSLPSGMYFVQVSNANSTSAKKLVIMR